jgi:hypothetical protein
VPIIRRRPPHWTATARMGRCVDAPFPPALTVLPAVLAEPSRSSPAEKRGLSARRQAAARQTVQRWPPACAAAPSARAHPRGGASHPVRPAAASP